MTNKQYELYELITKYIERHNQSPTLGELSIESGKARNTICDMLHRMSLKGYLTIKKGQARGIRLVVIDEYDDD